MITCTRIVFNIGNATSQFIGIIVAAGSFILLSGFQSTIQQVNPVYHPTCLYYPIAQEDTIPTVLFEISAPESNHVSFIFGTHHAFGKDFFDSLAIAKHKFLSSNLFIKETIPGPDANTIINARTESTNWRKLLSGPDKDYILDLLKNSELQLAKVRPSELSAILFRYYNAKICGARSTADSTVTLDDYIGELAISHHIPILGLETTHEQLELLRKDSEGMPQKVHKKRLAGIIDMIRSTDTSGCSQVTWYERMLIDYQIDQPCQNTLVLTDRNARWLDQIEPLLKTQNCFIAVGLSHLMYSCGIVNQLREKGYTVSPLAPG